MVRIAFAFLATILFFMGFHSIDIAYNMDNLDRELMLGGNTTSKDETYRQGLIELFSGFFLLLILFLM